MTALEDTYFTMASKWEDPRRNCLVICDRGAMDAAAFVDQRQWVRLLERTGKDEIELCEDRYDHVVHMVRALREGKE